MSVRHIAWDMYGMWVSLLAVAVKARHATAEFVDVVAISRGGLLPAVAITNQVPTLRLHVWDVRRYPQPGSSGRRGEPVIRIAPSPFKGARISGGSVLVVDDVVDEGITVGCVVNALHMQAQAAEQRPQQVVIATLCAAQRHMVGRCGVDGDMIAASQKGDNETVRFPYEV